ncbi:hypothetical protein H6B11_03335 [Mediterraneibacter glycyrrhizinilyticus]|nr:hypothetical protein [Mediterraneibacter glycyrrhizinilyticus]MBM6853199.1 hypothetical protein [Mediterraneibacter glycyrrhizinilyticus]
MIERFKLQEGYGIFEFLGNDIDAGFRIKENTQNRLYPIIWYHDERFAGETIFEDSFYYDEKENSELVRAYFENREQSSLKKEMYTDVDYALKKILSDQKLEDKFLRIDEIMKESLFVITERRKRS